MYFFLILPFHNDSYDGWYELLNTQHTTASFGPNGDDNECQYENRHNRIVCALLTMDVMPSRRQPPKAIRETPRFDLIWNVELLVCTT